MNIIMIDDDPIFNFIYTKMIKKLNIDAEITTHFDGKYGMEYLKNNYKTDKQFVIFLDINMPIMNGWEFLEEIEKLEYVTENIAVYMVSSSTDQDDIDKARNYKYVKRFLSKPLMIETLKEILVVD
jgi:response regulator RpfG family c-di-GMP phosphodiesterase